MQAAGFGFFPNVFERASRVLLLWLTTPKVAGCLATFIHLGAALKAGDAKKSGN